MRHLEESVGEYQSLKISTVCLGGLVDYPNSNLIFCSVGSVI